MEGGIFNLLGVELSTISAGNWLVIAMMIGGAAAIWWIRGMPERHRAANEAMRLKISEAEVIRTDYAKQIQEFRQEVQGYRAEMARLQADLTAARQMSMRRGDRLNMVFFILRLVMDELRRIDPESETLAHAQALLALVSHPEREDGASENDEPGRDK